jgi:hypothetical protein
MNLEQTYADMIHDYAKLALEKSQALGNPEDVANFIISLGMNTFVSLFLMAVSPFDLKEKEILNMKNGALENITRLLKKEIMAMMIVKQSKEDAKKKRDIH